MLIYSYLNMLFLELVAYYLTLDIIGIIIVLNVIKELKHNSPGWDEFPTSIFQPCMEVYSDPLTYILLISLFVKVY